MATASSIHGAPATGKPHATETREQRNRRVTIEALRAGVRVDSAWGTRTNVWSPRSQHLYEVHELEEGATFCWVCDPHCEWALRHGEYEQYNVGTLLHSHNQVIPCAHVLIAILWHLGAVKRLALFAADPELGAAWQAAHWGEIV